MEAILPKEITKDSDNHTEMASFNYYDGLAVAKKRNLQQSTSIRDVYNDTHFMVCCGDVMFKVTSKEYPSIERRVI